MNRLDEPEALARASLVAAMWSYTATILQPLHELRRRGWLKRADLAGLAGTLPRRRGLGAHFSRLHDAPVLLEESAANHLVEEFDRMAEVYDSYVRSFSMPIFEEALAVIAPLIDPAARVLDAGCGAGREMQRMARLVPDGEVVGIDLAAGMVRAAFRGMRAHGIRNAAFFQSDAGALPEAFDGAFDIVYSSLAHHHYPDPPAATSAIFRALRPGGIYAVVDPGPQWFTASAAPLAKWADPGWIGFHTPEEFHALFDAAGFGDFASAEILPGFCVFVGVKPLNAPAPAARSGASPRP